MKIKDRSGFLGGLAIVLLLAVAIFLIPQADAMAAADDFSQKPCGPGVCGTDDTGIEIKYIGRFNFTNLYWLFRFYGWSMP